MITESAQTTLRVDVLGPLRLLVDGDPVDVPGERRRALLALLALPPVAQASEARRENAGHLADGTVIEARLDKAARNFCRDSRRPASRVAERAACERAVRDEAMSQLPEYAQVRYAVSRLPVVA